MTFLAHFSNIKVVVLSSFTMHLDIRTIIFIISTVQALFTIGLYFIKRTRIKSSTFSMIISAFICGSIGGFLISYRDIIHPFFSIIVANILILSNPVFLFEEILNFLRIKSRGRLIGPTLLLIAIPILSYTTFIAPNLHARIIVISAFFATQTLLCAYILMTKVDRNLIQPAFATAYIFIFATLIMSIRIVLTLFLPSESNFMASGFNQSILQMSHLIYIIGLFLGFIWLHIQRLGYGLTTALRDVSNGIHDQFSFIDVVCHELKTPLTTIRNSTESLFMRSKDMDSTQKKAFDRIERSFDRLDNFLDVSLKQQWLSTDQIHNKIAPLSIIELVKTAAEISMECFPKHTIKINPVTSWTGNDMILADYNSLLSALNNIFDNAIKFSPSQKDIIVEIGQADKMLTLTIKDQGCGIRLHNKERVFEKYYRTDDVGKLPGSGIGLFIVKHIIQANNGTVTIDNQKSGGCRVDICLPLAPDDHYAQNRTY